MIVGSRCWWSSFHIRVVCGGGGLVDKQRYPVSDGVGGVVDGVAVVDGVVDKSYRKPQVLHSSSQNSTRRQETSW